MKRIVLLAALTLTSVGWIGCGWMTGAEAGGPEATVSRFLEAVRIGDEAQAAGLLTPLARQRTGQLDMQVAPPGSETASYEVGQVTPIDGATAHVASTWTDLDVHGQTRTDEIIWTVRSTSEGWRIAGMAAKVFADRPPVVMNFENPEEMIRQQELVEAEVRERADQQNLEARKLDDPFQAGPK